MPCALAESDLLAEMLQILGGLYCYHSVQKLLSSWLLSRNLKSKVYRTIITPVVLYACETW